MLKRLTAFFLIFLMLSCSMKLLNQKKLTLGDVEPFFEKLNPKVFEDIDFFQKHNIEYPVIGKEPYDSFYKNSGIIKGSVFVINDFLEYMIINLKGYARSYVSKHQMDENIQELIGDTDLDSLTVEQSAAVLELKKGRNEMTAEETKFMAGLAVNAGVIIYLIAKIGDKIPDMIKQGNHMINNIENDFRYDTETVVEDNTNKNSKIKEKKETSENRTVRHGDLYTGIMVTLAATGISDSIANLTDAGSKIPDLAREANVLYNAVKMFLND